MTLRRTLLIALASFSLVACHRGDEVPGTKPSGSANAQPGAEVAQAPTSTFEINYRAMGQRVPVIMYHDFHESRGRSSVWFDCTREEFEAQMKLIQERGYTPISLADFHAHLTSGKAIPAKAIILTFDDNYQGFYNIAYPILKKLNFPASLFIYTKAVGTKTGTHPNMDWETLKQLSQDPLITIAAHTVSHADLTTLTPVQQRAEMTESNAELEKQLGKKIEFFAYPGGKYDKVTLGIAKEVGYLMTFSVDNMLAEDSPSIEAVGRYVHTRLETALDDADAANESIGLYEGKLKVGPVAFKEQEVGKNTLVLVSGGTPMSITSASREMVLDFMHRTPNAVAGINGTFFSMAAVQSTDNRLVGPAKASNDLAVIPDFETTRWHKLRNRPMVIWSPTKVALVPFNPDRFNSDETIKEIVPDVTDLFLGGAWLVHAGVAKTKDQLLKFGSKDVQDPRRRAAFGIMADGTAVAAASKDSVSSSTFAEMLQEAGVQEAVLLDSGFSTSLVYGEKVMASGHSTKDKPSRPVPHAIVFIGQLDPASQEAAEKAKPATDPILASKTRKKKKKKVEEEPATVTVTPADPGSTPPATPEPGTPAPTTPTDPPTDPPKDPPTGGPPI